MTAWRAFREWSWWLKGPALGALVVIVIGVGGIACGDDAEVVNEVEGVVTDRPTTAADAVETIKAEVTITQGRQTQEAGQQASGTPRSAITDTPLSPEPSRTAPPLEPTSTPVPPAPTVPPVTNRRDCSAIRGTDYLSQEERAWFLDNCVPPSPTPLPPPPAQQNCHPSYPDVCLATNAGDYDCAGGSGNGPNYVRGPLRVLPPDPFGLDRDGDGIGCE